MTSFAQLDLHTLRNTAYGEESVQRLLSEEASRLENHLVAQHSRDASWQLGAASSLSPWSWNSSTTEQILLEERVRLQLETLTTGTVSFPQTRSDSAGNSVALHCGAQVDLSEGSTSSKSEYSASTQCAPGGAEEGIVEVKDCGTRRLFAYVTLFASGFVIGPKGKSIRKIEILSRCRISSSIVDTDPKRKIRLFCIDGDSAARSVAYRILSAAVARYKVLCDSTAARKKVEHVQNIEGVKFYYYPPPKSQNRTNNDG